MRFSLQNSRWIEGLIVLAFAAAILAGLVTGSASPAAPAVPARSGSAIPSPSQTATPGPEIYLPPGFTPSPTVTLAPDQLGRRITFAAEDGRELVGYFYPAWKENAPLVVLMHDFLSTQAAWKESNLIPWMQNWGALDPPDQPFPYAGGRLPQMPADVSFAVFTFDFRGHGESLPALESPDAARYAPQFLMDARAAYAIARSMPGVDPQRVIGIGTSIGADAVVDACGIWCAGTFSISPGNWLEVDFATAAQSLLNRGRPVRCMYSANDLPSPQTCWSLPPSDLYRIFGYPGIKHGMTFLVPRKMAADFGANLLEFLLVASQ